ncbi:hypothetical protein LAZ67_X002168 [Cordylochernes scorpioides]|uniref:Uncharacterized protein n=1 Tax=Cordylochernes scorpioides TaxID=51811 RepID=A0ABY6LVB1_9ARAC|nr:hypothetical protein LAZ67_X002168 [Cordylochernes scorpioides]
MSELTESEIEECKKMLETISIQINQILSSIQSNIGPLKDNLASMESRLRRFENSEDDVPETTPPSVRIAANSPRLDTMEYFAKIKPPTYDGQTSWSCYKTQFEVVALDNRWNPSDNNEQ